jgi:enoyl-CoA hydratase/carnithine racemase
MEEDRIRSIARSRGRVAAAVAAVVAGAAALAAAVVGVRVAVRGARMGLDGVRLAYAAATFRLYRRCPDCRRWLRGDARVCWRCGFKRPGGRRWPRSRGRF